MCFPQCYIQVSCFQPCLNIPPGTTGKSPQKFPGSSLWKYSSCEMANYLFSILPFLFLTQSTLSCSHIAYFTSLPFVATLNWQRTTLPSSYSHTKLLYSRCCSKNKGAFSPLTLNIVCLNTHQQSLNDRQLKLHNWREPQATNISIHSQSPDFTWKCFHAMARGNWYLESKVYSTILPFLSLSGPSEGDCHFHGVTEQERIRTGMLFHEDLVCFWWYKRKSSPIHLPEKSALNSCEFLWSW